MSETRIQFNSIVENQLPNFVVEEFPLVAEFLSQYYKSLEYQGGATDLLQNIDKYVKVDTLSNLIDSTTLTSNVDYVSATINVASTAGFPDKYGLIQIDSEIITYTGKTSTSFTGCVRGFCGITSLKDKLIPDKLVFNDSVADLHSSGKTVTNLSILFLKEFFTKVKKQILPGFENRTLYSGLNDSLFIKQSNDFYASKGTDSSFKILFGALYGEKVEVVRPRDFLIQPSDAQYRITSDLVVEKVDGDPLQLENCTLYQDQTDFSEKAQGTISKVEKIVRNGKVYYVISLDSDYNKDIGVTGSVSGTFNINPQTKVITRVSSGSTTIDVDSTVGFGKTGSLLVDLDNDTTLSINYTSKSLNQFFGCSGINQVIPSGQKIRLDSYAYGYVGLGTTSQVKVRVTGVLSDLKYPDNTYLHKKGDLVQVSTLGIGLTESKANNWFFNIATRYDVKSIELLDSSDYTYKINLYDEHSFSVGDSVSFSSLSSSSTSEVLSTGNVISFSDKKSLIVNGQGILNEAESYVVRKNLLKVNSKNYPGLEKYTSNVQNVYVDDENSLYVASPSLPTYLNQPLTIRDKSVIIGDGSSATFSGTTLNIGPHGFYTGDAIVYKPVSSTNTLGISTGVYFVKRVDANTIKLARSRDNIFTNNFVTVNGTVLNNKLEFADFTYTDFSTQLLEPQKLYRKLSSPVDDVVNQETVPGETGILVNGVEVLNYKSKDNIYFGAIESIIPTSAGDGYDVINPPVLTITDQVGSGASAYCSVIGSLERIDIVDPGFDYLNEPVITISGGNGTGASAKPRMVTFEHNVDFNSSSTGTSVNLSNNTIGFTTYHRFRDGEKVIYDTQSGTAVGGLSTNASYFVSVQNDLTIKVCNSLSDVIAGVAISLTSYGTGTHILRSTNKKKRLGSISIENPGQNYQNKKTTTTTAGINTSLNCIEIANHGYESGEIVYYTASDVAVAGLSSGTSYYVTKIDSNKFRLSSIGVGTASEFYYKTKQYVDLTSTGSGTHTFNYQPITVSISGIIGVSTVSSQNFSAVLQPVFRGKIASVFVESGGIKYGSEEIINFNRQPLFTLQSGAEAQVTPIISNGQIVQVVVNNPGYGYNSPPNLTINGEGTGAILSPVLRDGKLIDVKVIFGGIGYLQKNTSIDVISAGSDAKFRSQIKPWKINLVQRSIETQQITDDDGFLDRGLNPNFGLQYTHLYAPRKLRESILSSRYDNGVLTYSKDLETINGIENDTLVKKSHSPIIGWSYDGNPIYGPYGYPTKTGGTIRCMTSGYVLSLKPNRPSLSLYPQGFFVEDYEYRPGFDLDEHNGRFCVTPEYPNGVYAYFMTIDPYTTESSGAFKNYKKPVFPYVIGNTYKSKPIEFNFDTLSNQDDLDLNETTFRRNITPYNLLNINSYYDFITNPDSVKRQIGYVSSVATGGVDYVGIITGGQDYRVGDKVVFDNSGTNGRSASVVVSTVKGKEVSQISVATSTLNDVQFYSPNNTNYFVGFSTVPHDFINNDLVAVCGNYDYEESGTINISQNRLTLTAGVGSAVYTGIVTYFSVSGNLSFPFIAENDVYQFGNEQVKILNIDAASSRVRVLRNQNGTTGLSSYSAGIALTEKTRKFRLNFGISTSYNFNIDRQLYFNPVESVGLGTTAGVGINSTIYFSNPGVGATQTTIPTQSIYLPNHNLRTGDSVVYSTNGGTAVSVSTNGSSSFTLSNNQIVYVAKISNDLIGIATAKVGLGSTGSFVGVGTSSVRILYFTSVGTGSTHSFKTNYENTLTAQVSKNVVTVSTASTHGLLLNDEVIVDVVSGITTYITIKYDDYNRRIIVNPRSFISSNVNISDNSITISDHNFYTGQKIIHTSASPCGGLFNEAIYYVVTISPDKIRLSTTHYGATKSNPDIVDITSASTGTISQINPGLTITKNSKVVFDLSDTSLSFINNATQYPAFEFDVFYDSLFKNKFDSSKSSQNFEISRTGTVGVDGTVVLNSNDNIPEVLYYNLTPINLDINSPVKTSIIVDDEVASNNQLTIKESAYNGTRRVVDVNSNSFTFNILEKPEQVSYASTNSSLNYYTNSSTAYGEIYDILIKDSGRGYESLPGITSIASNSGSGALLELRTTSIGRIRKTYLDDIGFEYYCDNTLRPTAKLPEIIKLEQLTSIESINVSSVGVGYNIAPNLVVVDGFTNKPDFNVELDYNLEDRTVRIVKNTTGLSNVTPTIIPANNPNGIGIGSISYNPSTKDVTVSLASSFSDPEDFPFVVGDKVLIENISVGIGSTGIGYNSSNYDYALFTLTSVYSALGGVGAAVTYSLSNYIPAGKIPGTFDSVNSSGKIIPQKHFPTFNTILKVNDFYIGEDVEVNGQFGRVDSWDPDNKYLKVSTNSEFAIGETVIGRSSTAQGIIKTIDKFESVYDVKGSSIVRKGWNVDTGFLNNNQQRIHDSDYYQYFSYSLKSNVDYSTWENSVSTLNHTAGFKKFSDLIIESAPSTFAGISTSQNLGDSSLMIDVQSSANLNCVYDFDLVSENNITIDGNIKSDEIIFNSWDIQDYIESIGNRVLLIDDLSDVFNSNPRPTPFSVVDSFSLTSFRSKKYISFIKDKKFDFDREVLLASFIHDGTNGYLNQYGRVETVKDLGFFDFTISGNEGNLLFYPNKSKINNYDLGLLSFNLNDLTTGIGTVNLGNVAKLQTNTATISTGSSTVTVVGIASTYRASKVLVQIGATNSSYYEYDEITLLHDGTDIHIIDYGQITTDTVSSVSSVGIGTYHAYFSGSNLNIDLICGSPVSVNHVINTFQISIANTSFTGIGSTTLSNSKIHSSYVSIASSTSPIENLVATYPSQVNEYSCSYFIVSIEDTTNSEYHTSELIVLHEGNDAYVTEFGIITSSNSLGYFTANVVGANTEIYFTPNANIDVQLRIVQTDLGLSQDNTVIDLTNGSINYDNGIYFGTDVDIRKSFDLTHKQKPIFQKAFNAEDSSIVNISRDTIKIPGHFFVTGEKVQYSYPSTSSPISIASTNIPGIGVTNKLPPTLYIVKVDDLNVKVSASASDALKSVPTVLDITSVGIGTTHTFTSINQNVKSLLTIDNMIQSPVVATSVTTTLDESVSQFNGTLKFTGITSFFGGDLIKIDDEIMKITAVGVGSTNFVIVDRPWMGTGISSHSQNSLITKLSGNYNIIDNTVHFAQAPYGKIPLINISNRADELDYVGLVTSSTFNGRVFLKGSEENSLNETYHKNYLFDDITNRFNGITTQFTLKSSNSNISGISTSNAIILVNDIFQVPARGGSIVSIPGNYDLVESVGVTSISFVGSGIATTYDVNTSTSPRGGIIVSNGSSEGFGYQPLVSAGGTAIVSIAGTISSISIGNSGSGYRSGVQTVRVGVGTSSTGTPNVQYVGVATVNGGYITGVAITNPGTGYTSTNPPYVFFDAPLSYSDIPLVYSSSSVSGVGTGAKVSIVVGQGSSVIGYEITNSGYAYGQGEVLTVAIGGTVGIPTTSSFQEFRISIERTQTDEFTGWSIGDLQVLDPFDNLFNGMRRVFPIRIDAVPTSIRAKKGSSIDIQSTLLVFLNNVLQIPGESYIFDGGSTIEFTEPPQEGDICNILFYKGNGDVDTAVIDVLEPVKVGDTITINSDDPKLQQNQRLVLDVLSSDIVETNVYSGKGITNNPSTLRPVTLCRQTEDKIINGFGVGKDRTYYEPLIQPTTNIIQSIGVSSSVIFVESVKTFFDSEKEYIHDGTSEKPQRFITITSQDSISAATATAVVSIAGTISSIVVSDGGVGYTTAPSVIIANPVGLGTTQRATATASLSGSSVSSISITSPGTGYTTSNPPVVLIEVPSPKIEKISNVTYEGDFGIITGVGTTSVGVASTGIVFDLFIPKNSFLRDLDINSVGIATTGVSGIQTGYYFVVHNSNIGGSLTSLNSSGGVVGVGTTFIDNIYQAVSVSIAQTHAIGVGLTYVAKVTVSVSDYNGLTGLGYSSFFGEYSWGRLSSLSRGNPKAFTSYNNGLLGISTSPVVQRVNPLKYSNYTT